MRGLFGDATRKIFSQSRLTVSPDSSWRIWSLAEEVFVMKFISCVCWIVSQRFWPCWQLPRQRRQQQQLLPEPEQAAQQDPPCPCQSWLLPSSAAHHCCKLRIPSCTRSRLGGARIWNIVKPHTKKRKENELERTQLFAGTFRKLAHFLVLEFIRCNNSSQQQQLKKNNTFSLPFWWHGSQKCVVPQQNQMAETKLKPTTKTLEHTKKQLTNWAAKSAFPLVKLCMIFGLAAIHFWHVSTIKTHHFWWVAIFHLHSKPNHSSKTNQSLIFVTWFCSQFLRPPK